MNIALLKTSSVKLLWTTLLCLFFSTFSLAQFQTSVDTTHITIGEPIQLEISVPMEGKSNIELPYLQDTINYHIEILSQSIDTIDNKGKLTLVQRLKISSYDPGEFLVRSLPVVIDQDTLLTPSFQIQVDDVAIDSANLIGYPIIPIKSEQYTLKDYWDKYWPFILIGILVCFALLIVAILYLRSRKNKGKSHIVKTPYEEATDALKELDKKKYLSKDELNPFYSELSYILRRYLGRVYEFSSLELLSDDLIEYFINNDHLQTSEIDELKQFLFESDLVKYAKAVPEESKHEYYRKWVGELVENIRPLELDDELDYELKPNEEFRKVR